MDPNKIYLELGDIVDPKHSLLIVWDMQNALVNRTFNKIEILGSVTSLIRAARGMHVPLVYSKISPLPLQFQSPASLARQMKRMGITDVSKIHSPFGDDPKMMEIADVLGPEDQDIVLRKNTASIFMGTNFDYIARYGGVETLIFTGISTEMGIESSAREAINRGYYVVVVSDGVSSSNKDAHERSLANLKNLCEVVNHQEVISAWKP